MFNKKTAPARAASFQNTRERYNKNRLDFKGINKTALAALPALLCRWLPDGKRVGGEFIACNPRRQDNRAGSFKINLKTGKWADFATGDRGGDIISLAAYLGNIRQGEAAKKLAVMLGMGVRHDR